MNRLIGILSLLLNVCISYAQVDSISLIESVQIQLPSWQQQTHINTKNTTTLAEALRNQSSFYIKEYSAGGLATITIRGMAAQHTPVLWQGINISNGMNSIMDFNLIPSFFIDKVAIETDAASAQSGNGTLSGNIQLKNKINKTDAYTLQIGTGSYNSQNIGIKIPYSIGKLWLKTKFLYQKAKNNYEYTNIFLPNKPKELMQNNEWLQKGILHEMQFSKSAKSIWNANLWLLETNRQLPLPMGVINNSKEHQYDLNFRTIISNSYLLSTNKKINTSIAYLEDELNYYNNYLPNAYNKFKSFIFQNQIHLMYNKWKIFTEGNYTFQTAKCDGYTQWPERNSISYYTLIKYPLRKNVDISAGNRLQWIDAKWKPTSPELYINYSPIKIWNIHSSIARSFRQPNFNDYYWKPGGNINLLPEQGYKLDLGNQFTFKKWSTHFTMFYNQINNWILWLPASNGNFWQAQNAKQVTSKGFEYKFNYETKSKSYQLIWNASYQFAQSINNKTNDILKASLGKQLPYVPLHTANTNIAFTFKKIQSEINLHYTSSRYTTTDNNTLYALPSYYLININAGYIFQLGKHEISIMLHAKNVTNVSYQLLENRPLPLRNFKIQINYNIKYEH